MKRFAFARAVMGACLAGMAAALFLQPALAVAADVSTLWLQDQKQLKRIDLSTNQYVQTISLSRTSENIAFDAKTNILWALSNKHLLKFSSAGTLVSDFDLSSLVPNTEVLRRVALDPNDGSLWIGGERKSILHVSAQGTLLLQWVSPEDVKAIALHLDRTLFVLTLAHVYQVNASGTVTTVSSNVASVVPSAQFLAIDSWSDYLWVADATHLARFDLHTSLWSAISLPSSVTNNNPISALLARPVEGSLFAGTNQVLLIYSKDLALTRSVSLSSFALGGVAAMAFDYASQSLWLGGTSAAGRFTPAGDFVVKPIGSVKVSFFAGPALRLAPTVSLIAPANNSVTSNPRPLFRLGLGVECNGAACALPDSYFQTLAVTAILNGNAVGSFFTLNPTEAQFTPAAALPEGASNFTAHVTDDFGQISNEVTSQFTVDTIAPSISSVTPPDSSSVGTTAVTVSGQANDSSASVTLLDNLGNTLGTGPSSFSFNVTLVSGMNTFSLVARDPAGNQSSTPYRLTYDNIPPSFTTVSPADGSTVVSTNATVTGQVNDPAATVTLRDSGGNILSTGGASFSFSVTLVSGLNTFSLVAQDAAGNSATIPYRLTYTPLPPFTPPPVEPTVATNLQTSTDFLYTGANPVQTGVAVGTIQAKRVAVIRGKVLTRDGQPLAGATVRVVGRPEFGQTRSRLDGMFDLAVNGGGLLALSYEMSGYLSAQRQVQSPWQDYVQAPDVALSAVDGTVTAVDLTQPTMQVARGSIVTDSDGTRQATILFPAGTTATRLMPDGSTQPLSTVSVRATEYTVGVGGKTAMPAPLPPTSAYTYAVELSVDEFLSTGAKKTAGKDVLFNQPVPFYLDNFLNFPIGEVVPVGYYDNDKSAWIPYPNGRVIKVLSVTGGIAGLDTDGDNIEDTPAQLAALGISDSERTKLAAIYPAGKSLWRAALTHFSTWDFNWPFVPTAGAEAPKQPIPFTDKDTKPDEKCGSTIECQNQVLGESVAVTGTPFTLNYVSSRTPGFKPGYTVTVPLSGATIPPALLRIDLEVAVAGRVISQSFAASPNQNTVFQWDGLDAYGRAMLGSQPAVIRVGYVYGSVYVRGASAPASFGSAGITSTVFFPARSEFTFWQQTRTSLGAWDARANGLGGWTLSAHHAMDQAAVHLGTGKTDSVRTLTSVASTVAGNGTVGCSTGPVPATSAATNPSYVAVDSAGNLFILGGTSSSCIHKVTPDGILTFVLGVNSGRGIAFDSKDNLYIAAGGVDQVSHRVYKVTPQGAVSTVAGTIQGFGGDGGPATAAKLNGPIGVAVDSAGNVLIADSGNSRIRKVSPDGTISTVAGTGAGGFSGDGGPAINATFNSIFGLDVDIQGNIYVADANNNRVRKITSDGIIRTVAGNGTPPSFSGDGLQAVNVGIGPPWFVKVDRQGNIYIGDRSAPNSRLRRIGPDGVITAVIGTGAKAFSGDGGPARAAEVDAPLDAAFDPAGRLFIADQGNRRVRQVSPRQVGFDDADVTLASDDGSELYHFDRFGRHLRTLNAKTAAVRYTFTYNASGYLTQIQDGDSNITTIERSGNTVTAIVAPDGQRTTVGLDANGYLATITNPASEATTVVHASNGLLGRFTNARLNSSDMTYGTDGRLILDESAGDSFWSLSRTESSPSSYQVNVTSAMSRQSRYLVERLNTDDRRRTNTRPDATVSIELQKLDGTTSTTQPDGSIVSMTAGPDPRFGMQSSILKSGSIRMPSNLTMTMSGQRSVTLSNPADLLSMTSQTDTFTVNGKVTTSVYTASTRQQAVTTPVGRQFSSVTDTQGRTTRVQAAGIAPVDYGYDPRGRLASVTQTDGAETRSFGFAYNPQGFVSTVTDPLLRTYSYTYDLAGRPATLTLPGNRVIEWRYDANGNVSGIIPPSRPIHSFNYNAVDLEDRYAPPVVPGVTAPATQYAYNADNQLTTITRPDTQTVALGYDTSGRLGTVTLPGRTVTSGYSATTGNLTSLTTSPGVSLAYTYDGSLPLMETFSGAITGTVTRTYNSDFRVGTLTVNGTPISFSFDNDGLLTQTGSLTLTRDPQNGRITGTTIGSIATTQGYNGFGEVNSFTASYSGTTLFSATTTYDKLGHITQVSETIEGTTNSYIYDSDNLARLMAVTRNGTPLESYAYDDNGNRTSANGITASYDDQDRLLTFGPISYTHTENGERRTRISGSSTTTYTHDALGNLIQVTLPNGTIIDYVVDGRNRRVGRKVNGILVQGFLYEDQLRLVAELDGAGAVVSRFIYAERANVPEYIVKGSNSYRIVTDARGSARLVINVQTGATEQRIDYDAFGRVTFDTSPGFQPFGFAGGLYDRDANLIRFGARDYDPDTGLWMTKDPIGFDGGDTNLYGYVAANPITFTDPFGLRPEEEIGGKGGGFGSGPRVTRFPDLKDHAARHGNGQKPGQYLQDAMNNMARGRPFQYRHGGEQKLCFISRTGPDSFKFTSTNFDRTVIRTHMEVSSQYLGNLGITLPKGF